MKDKSLNIFRINKLSNFYVLVDLVVPGLILFFIHFFIGNSECTEVYFWIAILSGAIFTFSTAILIGYSDFYESSIAKKIETVFKTWVFNIFLLIFVLYLNASFFDVARSVFIVWSVITPFIVLFTKLLINYKSHTSQKERTEILVLGDGYRFNEFELANFKRHNVQLHIIVDYDKALLVDKVNSLSPDFLVINLDKSAEPNLIKQLTHLDLKGVQLLALNHFMENFLRKCFIPYESSELSYLEHIKAYSKVNYLLKRSFDAFVSITLLLLTWPLMLLAAYKIKKESPGSIFFKQSRVGLNGKDFQAIKFRSMHENSTFNPYTQEEDPRIFPFGNVMRKTRIDELPQLWNVLKGDMHLIGPRTEWDILVEDYEKEIPYYHERHLVRPGISGWAQVLYPYGANTEDARQKLMYDLYYIKHWSIWLEIETIIRTVGVVIGQKGL